jgi:DNA-binding MarR family transcriptional regulator
VRVWRAAARSRPRDEGCAHVGCSALLELTPQGRAALQADRSAREGWLIQAISEGFSEDEQDALLRAVPLLARLAEL